MLWKARREGRDENEKMESRDDEEQENNLTLSFQFVIMPQEILATHIIKEGNAKRG